CETDGLNSCHKRRRRLLNRYGVSVYRAQTVVELHQNHLTLRLLDRNEYAEEEIFLCAYVGRCDVTRTSCARHIMTANNSRIQSGGSRKAPCVPQCRVRSADDDFYTLKRPMFRSR
ncbi:unnamed protein product, partial [Rangifer tarandus platyrhynchus]